MDAAAPPEGCGQHQQMSAAELEQTLGCLMTHLERKESTSTVSEPVRYRPFSVDVASCEQNRESDTQKAER